MYSYGRRIAKKARLVAGLCFFRSYPCEVRAESVWGSMAAPYLLRKLNALDNRRNTLTQTNAHGGETDLAIFPFHDV
jgi:hypothetical protein